ncbi:hypothetical protein Tco_0796132 [Tanacetum coccineum]
MDSKLESKILKRLGIQLAQKSLKKLKTTKASGSELSQEQQTKEPKELSEEELKKMMEIVPAEEYMHDPLEWKLYDTCGVHHVSTRRGHKIFMLVKKDYPLTKGLTTVMLFQDDEVFRSILSRAPCAIKGVLRKNTENLNNIVMKLNEELSDCETDLIRVLKRDIEIRDNKIENLKNELEEVKKEKESIDFQIENFDNALKDLDSLLGNQRLDKDKKGLGFNEYSFVDDTVTDYSRPTPSIDVSKDVSDEQKAIWKSNSASFSEQGGSVGNVVSKPMIRFVKETGCPSVSKVNNTEKCRKPTVKYAKCTGHKGLGEIKGTGIIKSHNS